MYFETDITSLLAESKHDETAAERLYRLVYSELRGIAGRQLQMERPDHTLQATALANEVYIKLVGQAHVDWENRGHFFAIAARAARRLLVDHARARLRAERGGGAPHTSLTRAGKVHDPHFDTELVADDECGNFLAEPLNLGIVDLDDETVPKMDLAGRLDVSRTTRTGGVRTRTGGLCG